MNYTNNYHLPQWEKSDRIMMDDFNRMCADIDAGLVKTAQDAASGTSSVAGTVAKAQSTADSALVKANAAQSKADAAFCPDYMPFKTGTYVGNGTTVGISLGFRPSFVIFTRQETSTGDEIKEIAVAGPGGNLDNCVRFTSTGMNISLISLAIYPRLNMEGRTYSYIAFR